MFSFLWLFADERIECVEGVKEHVRIELALQRLELVPEVLRAELFVFQLHVVAFPVQMEQVTTAGHDEGIQQIA